MKFIAYYRVSTQKQGKSGLGLEAQKVEVEKYISGKGDLIETYIEIESGKNDKRIELNKALVECKKQNATLVVAKLDRLSRNVSFLFALKDSGASFVCCEQPLLNTLSLAVLAGLAQEERERISSRIKAALAAKKARGYKLGSPQNLPKDAHIKSCNVRKEIARNAVENRRAYELIKALKENGTTLRGIARRLNESGFNGTHGGSYSANSVKVIIRLYEGNK